MNLLKTLSVIGLIVAASAAPAGSSAQNEHAATVDKRDFGDFIQGAEDTGEDIKDFFTGEKRDWMDKTSDFFDNIGDAFTGDDDKQKRDWVEDASNFFDNIGDAFTGDDDKQKRDWIDDIGQFSENVKDMFDGDDK